MSTKDRNVDRQQRTREAQLHHPVETEVCLRVGGGVGGGGSRPSHALASESSKDESERDWTPRYVCVCVCAYVSV